MIDMFATKAEAEAFALAIDPAPLMDGEIDMCESCSRWGLADDMRYCSEAGVHECDECADKEAAKWAWMARAAAANRIPEHLVGLADWGLDEHDPRL